jgi:hypothetical protein
MTTRSDVMRRRRIGEVPYTLAIWWTAELGSTCCGLGPRSSPFHFQIMFAKGASRKGCPGVLHLGSPSPNCPGTWRLLVA